jgi:cob(I)alamin adenosyltransferase
MYNRRVSKTHPRVEACGTIDELNSAIGVARASSQSTELSKRLLKIQGDLITLMGELATLKEDLQRYVKDQFEQISATHYNPLEQWIREIEAGEISFKGWATPGATPTAAALDLARSICRRAERRVQGLLETAEIENEHLLVYLNRASDLLWLLARREETVAAKASQMG